MAEITAHTDVIMARSSMGRFIKSCDAAATRTVERTLDHGARVARAKAPSRARPDPRTKKLKQSIRGYMVSPREGVIASDARHALPIEYGSAPHPIVGDPYLHFYWEKVGRWVRLPRVMHPGNAPQPFLTPAYLSMGLRMMQIAKEEFPG